MCRLCQRLTLHSVIWPLAAGGQTPPTGMRGKARRSAASFASAGLVIWIMRRILRRMRGGGTCLRKAAGLHPLLPWRLCYVQS